jgi:hypothetical protein
MARDTRDAILRKLLAEMPELLADYLHLAQDVDGRVDAVRKQRHRKITSLLFKYQNWQSVR